MQPRSNLVSIQSSLSRYRKILESIAVDAWIADSQGYTRSIEVSSAQENLREVDGVDALASTHAQENQQISLEKRLAWVHPDDQGIVENAIQQGMLLQQPIDVTVRGNALDGRPGSFRIMSQPIFDSLGRLEEWVGFLTDVSQEVQAEDELRSQRDALQRSEQAIREQNVVLEQIATGKPLAMIFESLMRMIELTISNSIATVMLLDSSGRLYLAKGSKLPERFSEICNGLPIGPTTGSCGSAAFHKQTVIVEDIAKHPNWALYRDEALKSQLASCWSVPIFSSTSESPNAQPPHASVLGTFAVYHTSPRSPTSQELHFVERAGNLASIAIERDVAQRNLEAERDRLAAVTENSPCVICSMWIDANRLIAIPYASSTLKDLLGIEPAAVANDASAFLSLVEPNDLQRMLQLFRSQCTDEKQVETTFQIQVDDRKKWIEYRATPSQLPDGTYQLHGVLTDVTERKALSDRILQSQKIEAIGRLAGGIAHDFNNLLTVIVSGCELLEFQLIHDAKSLEHIEVMRSASRRAVGLTKQLLAFSRKSPMTVTVLDPNDVVRDIESLLRRVIGEDIILETKLESGIGSILGDSIQLEQVLINLCLNARDAMPSGGKIRISTELVSRKFEDANACLQSYVAIHVADSGDGIPKEIQNRVFDPFFTTKEPGQGTGLGLAVVHGIVTQNSGKISLESDSNGTTFHLFFPSLPGRSPESNTPSSEEQMSGEARKILVVDDERAIAEIAKLSLRPLGFEVQTATSYEEAIRLVESQNLDLDLLISDIVMPGRSGIELAEAVAAMRPNVKVLLMSGHEHDHLENRTSLQPFSFLPKPFTPLELTNAVRKALAQVIP